MSQKADRTNAGRPPQPTSPSLPSSSLSAGLGCVYLVGAGPGAAGLITWRGVQCLRRADVVLYDYLANAQLLEHARPEARRICLGRHGRSPIWSQPVIQQRLIDEARAGHTVVRLKGGDAGVFGRLSEELAALTAAGIPLEVVPGISAALAGPAFAGIPLTDRTFASAVAFVTAHESPDKDSPALDYPALARFPGTLVFYMGVTTAAQWSRELLEAGRDPATPVAAIRHVSGPRQEVWTGCLAEVGAWSEGPPKPRPPIIFVCGDVVRLRTGLSWFEQRPLFGCRILVTRPQHQATELAEPLTDLGAEVLVQPAIQIAPVTQWQAVDAVCQHLEDFDWLVFSSANGVRAFLDRLWQLGRDLRALRAVRIAAIGPGTARALQSYRLRADLVPDQYRAEALAQALQAQGAGARFLLLRASRGREVLAQQLRAAGAMVREVVVYQSQDVAQCEPSVRELLERGQIHWVTVTSSAIARALHQLGGSLLTQTCLASLSPVTSQTLQQLGHQVACEATTYTMPGLVQALLEAEGQRRGRLQHARDPRSDQP